MGTEKIKAKAKKAAATIKGEVGILATLKGEHAEVSDLMMTLRQKDDGDLHTRNELFQKIRTKLLVHARAEQQVFYAECLRHEELAETIATSQQEHDAIETLLHQLTVTALDALGWMDTFRQLQETVEGHVRFEEHDVFSRARDFLDRDALRRLGEDYEKQKANVERTLPTIELPGSPSLGEQWP